VSPHRREFRHFGCECLALERLRRRHQLATRAVRRQLIGCTFSRPGPPRELRFCLVPPSG
jgi:hypothetical protein